MPQNDYKNFSRTKVGDSFKRPVFIKAIEEKPTKTGDLYLTFTLLDGESEISANYFGKNAAQAAQDGLKAGAIADADIKVADYKGKKSFTVTDMTPYQGSEFKESDFIITAPIDADVMFDEIIQTLRSAGDDMGGTVTPVSELAVMILESFKKDFTTSSAAKSMHHNFKSGLIYHTYRMVKAAEVMCGVYHELDKELLISSAAIHDIGKIWEYKTDPLGSAELTSNGVLFGHLYLGANLVSQYKDKYPAAHPDAPAFDPEKVKLLTHIILAHHGIREWGAVATPAIPEACVLFHIDSIDAKINSYEKEYAKLRPGDVTQNTPFGFDGKIYKPVYKYSDK